MKLLTNNKIGVSGYKVSEVMELVIGLKLLEKWQNFSLGITGCFIDGNPCFYNYDVNEFLEKNNISILNQ